jgi:hypothetical protein
MSRPLQGLALAHKFSTIRHAELVSASISGKDGVSDKMDPETSSG